MTTTEYQKKYWKNNPDKYKTMLKKIKERINSSEKIKREYLKTRKKWIAKHPKYLSEYMKKKRADAKLNGICTQCFKNNLKSSALCSICLKNNNKKTKKVKNGTNHRKRQ